MNIFVVDDDESIVVLIQKHLKHDYRVHTFECVEAVRKGLEESIPDIMIVDDGLPDGSGIDFCNEVRENYPAHIYIIVLTGDKELSSKLRAYQYGADDYLVKPFEALELLAKLKNIGARIHQQNHSEFSIGDLQFDLLKMQVIQKDCGEIELTPKEFKILSFMAQNEGRVFSREQILDKVWSKQINITDRTVDQHITHIRKKTSNTLISIEPVRGEGYKLLKKQSQ